MAGRRIFLNDEDKRTVRYSKIEAAKDQLNAAIEMWFYGGSEIAIHTLLFAAYQIISDLNHSRKTGTESLFAPEAINSNLHKDWRKAIRIAGRYLKHADQDADAFLLFRPITNFLFILYSLSGLEALGEEAPQNLVLLAIWMTLHEPRLMAPNARDRFAMSVSPEELARYERMTKAEFFKHMRNARASQVLSGRRIETRIF